MLPLAVTTLMAGYEVVQVAAQMVPIEQGQLVQRKNKVEQVKELAVQIEEVD